MRRRSALETITEDRALAPLWRLLEAGAVDRRFFDRWFRSNATYGRRNLLLRMALGDSRNGATNQPLRLRLDASLLQRIVTFLKADPALPLDPFTSRFGRNVPTHLRCLFGQPVMSDAEFVRRAIVKPYVRAMTGGQPYHALPGAVTAAQARRILPPVAGHVLLSPADAEGFLSDRRDKATRTTGHFFFDTGSLALDVRNVLLFAAVLFRKTGHGGRLQSRLPTALLARVGIKREERHVSIPQLLFAVDLAALAILGLLVPGRPGRESVPLAATIDALQRQRLPAFPADLRSLARAHFQRTLLDPAASAALCAAQDRGRWERMYGNGLLFNLRRLVGEDAAIRRFAAFAPLYRRIDTLRLRREVLAHFRRVDPDFGQALGTLMRAAPEEFEGTDARSLANALFHARFLQVSGEKPGARLPSVAKYRLGAPAYTGTGARSHLRRPRRRRGIATRRQVTILPLLEQLARKAPILP